MVQWWPPLVALSPLLPSTINFSAPTLPSALCNALAWYSLRGLLEIRLWHLPGLWCRGGPSLRPGPSVLRPGLRVGLRRRQTSRGWPPPPTTDGASRSAAPRTSLPARCRSASGRSRRRVAGRSLRLHPSRTAPRSSQWATCPRRVARSRLRLSGSLSSSSPPAAFLGVGGMTPYVVTS